MLKIKMQRIGRTNMPAFRIVVAEHTVGPKSGKFVEKVGTYNPKTKERTLNAERITYWMSVGAKPSETVHNMLITAGVIKGQKINVLPKNKNRKPEPTAADTSTSTAPTTAAASDDTTTDTQEEVATEAEATATAE